MPINNVNPKGVSWDRIPIQILQDLVVNPSEFKLFQDYFK